ncbi:MAG: hypothetical protein H7326_03610 [Bdellovibrionaceae bacterium]|nr:hypothetical protein [Pseudobdellovibrionaceae bacterium]
MTGRDNPDQYKLEMVVIPIDGIGRQLVVQKNNERVKIKLFWKLVLAYPKSYARFGIFADQNRFVLPDDVRFNKLNAGGLRLLLLPPHVPQLYSNTFLVRQLRRWVEPKASQGGLLEHDYLQDHFAGSIAAPKWMYEKAVQFADFQTGLLKIADDAGLPKDYRKGIEGSLTEKHWDSFTNSLGSAITQLAENPGVVTAQNILRIRKVLLQYDTIFSGSAYDCVLTVNDIYSGQIFSQVDYQIYSLHKMTGLNEAQAKPVEDQIRAMQVKISTPQRSLESISSWSFEPTKQCATVRKPGPGDR